MPPEARAPRPAPLRRGDVAGVALAAAVLRLAHLLAVRGDLLFQAVLGDSELYVERARALLAGETSPAHAFTPPLYPVILASVFAAAGPALELVRWLQAALGTAAAAAIAVAAGLLWGRRAAWVAGLVVAASPVAVFFDGELLAASAVFALVALGIAAAARGVAGGGPGALAAAGAAFAGAALGQPQAAVLVAGAAPIALLGPRPRARLGALAGAAAAVLLAGSAVEWWASGHWVGISAGAGVNLAIGNHAGAEGGFELPPGSGLVNTAFGLYPAARGVAVAATGDSTLGPSAVSRYWTGRTLDWARSAPGEACLLVLKKLLLAVNHYEVPNHYTLDYFAPRSPVLAWSPVRFAWVGPVGLAGLAALALGRRRDRAAPWLLLSVALYLAVLALFFVTDRYRLPLWAFLALGAAAAVETAAAARRARDWRRLALLAGGIGLLVPLSVMPPHPRFSPAHMHILLADVLGARGDVAGRLRALERAASYGEMPEAAQNLANSYFRARRYREAAAQYRAALALDPDAPQSLHGLGLAELELGRPEAALEPLARAAAAAPGDARIAEALARARAAAADTAPADLGAGARRARARAFFARGVAEARAGRRDSALAAFRRGLELEPGDAAAHLNLGLLAELDGDLVAAERELEAAAAAGAADHIERLLALARIASRRGDQAAARAFFDQAAAVAPDDPRVRAGLRALAPVGGR